MTIVTKTTVGFVCQSFDTETQKYTEQEFICGDDVTYEVDGETEFEGEPASELMQTEDIGSILVEPYLPYNMVQPDKAALVPAAYVGVEDEENYPNLDERLFVQLDRWRDDVQALLNDMSVPDSKLDDVTIIVNSELFTSICIIQDLATQNALEESDDEATRDDYLAQHQALSVVAIMLDEVRRKNPRPLTSYQQVITELVNGASEGNTPDAQIRLLDLALDAIRDEVGRELARQ